MNYQGLKSYDGKVSDMEFNKLVDAVQANGLNQGVGYNITQTAGGTTLNIKTSKNLVSGKFGNPYILGSLNSGSRGAGGSADIQTGVISGAYQDTWNRDNPPLNASNVQTTGVKLDLIRIYNYEQGYGSFDQFVFTRTAIFDNLGCLYSVSAETLEQTSLITGYGTAGGGI